MDQFRGILGIGVLIGIAWLLSTARRQINWRLIGAALLLQIVLAFLILKFEPAVRLFNELAWLVNKIISFADDGTRFLFGA